MATDGEAAGGKRFCDLEACRDGSGKLVRYMALIAEGLGPPPRGPGLPVRSFPQLWLGVLKFRYFIVLQLQWRRKQSEFRLIESEFLGRFEPDETEKLRRKHRL